MYAADFSSHPPTYEYGEIVSLRCRGFQEIGDPDPPYTFIWTAPEGSTSLTRDTSSFVNTSASSRLTFTAFQEDSGQYTCDIVGNSIYPVPKTTITIGNFLFLFLFCIDIAMGC